MELTRPASESRSSVSFDQPLDQAHLDIDDKKRANLLAWRGQFSPQFVQAILENYADKDDVVLDPFVGSGTVLVESAYLGHEAFGYEVNPAAELLAKVYTFASYNKKERNSLISSTDRYLSKFIPLGLPLFEQGGVSSNDGISITPLISNLIQLKNRGVKVLVEGLNRKIRFEGQQHFDGILSGQNGTNSFGQNGTNSVSSLKPCHKLKKRFPSH